MRAGVYIKYLIAVQSIITCQVVIVILCEVTNIFTNTRYHVTAMGHDLCRPDAVSSLVLFCFSVHVALAHSASCLFILRNIHLYHTVYTY